MVWYLNGIIDMNADEIEVQEQTDGVTITVRVQPRSSKNGIAGVCQGALKVALNVPPVDGAANAACCELLAKKFTVAKSMVEILRGHNNRNKIIKIKNITKRELLEFLQ